MTLEEYFKKAQYIWQNFVPKSGQSTSVQGELLRAIEKLRDEAQRNGNINFNKGCHIILIEYLRDYLCEKEIFSDEIIKQINSDLDRLSIEDSPYLDDDLYDRINDRIVDWYIANPKGLKHKHNPNLNC